MWCNCGIPLSSWLFGRVHQARFNLSLRFYSTIFVHHIYHPWWLWSSTHSHPFQDWLPNLIHRFYLTNHHSSLEHAIYATSCLLLAFLNLTACHHSNLRSISLIWSLSPLSHLLSSFFLFCSSESRKMGASDRLPKMATNGHTFTHFRKFFNSIWVTEYWFESVKT